MAVHEPPDDPVFLHARREAILMLLVWLAFFLWVVPYCYWKGYATPAQPLELKLVLGMPAWVFWGILVPWVTAGVVSIVLCVWFIQDDDLGPAPEDVEEASAA